MTEEQAQPDPEQAGSLQTDGISRREFLKRTAAPALLLGGAALSQWGVLGSSSLQAVAAQKSSSTKNQPEKLQPEGTCTRLRAKNYDYLIGRVEGLTENQLKQHIKLYEGYVEKLNTIQLSLSQASELQSELQLDKANGTWHPYRELLTEQSFAHNGVVFHELYFETLGGLPHGSDETSTSDVGMPTPPNDKVKEAFTKAFGSWQSYIEQLKAAGKSSRGWVMTGLNLRDGQLYNYTMDMHHIGVPLYVAPLVVLDVYEHAYMIDYGTNRGKYLDVFLNNIHWNEVSRRLDLAQRQPAILL